MFAAFLVALAVLGFLGLVTILVMGGVEPIEALQGPRKGRFLILTVLPTALTLVATAVVFALPRTPARLGLVAFAGPPSAWLAAVVGVLALGEVLDSLVALLGLFDHGALGEFRRAVAGADRNELILAMFTLGLCAGTAEELFFRGLLQPRFVERWGPWAGIAVTAFLFGLMHFDPIHSTLAGAMGLWLGFVRHRTGSVLPTMAAHVINNIVATLGAASGLVPDRPLVTAAVGAGATLLLVLAFLRLRRVSPPPAASPVELRAAV
jgi:membrane protease YdiL (CAAX protease family)